MLAQALETAQPGAGQAIMELIAQLDADGSGRGTQVLSLLTQTFMRAEQEVGPGAGAQEVVRLLVEQGILGGPPGMEQAPPPGMEQAPPMGMEQAPPPGAVAPPMGEGAPPPGGLPAPQVGPPPPAPAPEPGRQVVKAKQKKPPPKYKLPKLDKSRWAKQAPTIAHIYRVARAGETMWRANRERQKLDLACWKGEMSSLDRYGGTTDAPGRLVHQRLTAFTYVERVTTMVAWNNDTEMDLPARADDDDHREAAQKTENWLRTQRHNDSKRWRRRGEYGDPQPALERVEAQGMVLLGGTGWQWEIAPDDPDHPFRDRYVPWGELYPVGDEITRQYVVSLAQLRAECPEVDEYYGDDDGNENDDTRKVKVIGWCDRQGYRHGICWQEEGGGWASYRPPTDDGGSVKERWIKKPDKVIGLGFPYYNLAIAVSAPAIDEDTDDYRKWVGIGVLTRAVPHFRLVNFVGEMALKGFLRDIDPPTLQTHQQGTDLSRVPLVETEAGDRNFGFNGDRVEILGRAGTGSADGTTTLNMLASDQQDLVPPAIGGQRQGNSGFQQMQTEQAASAVTVGPIMDAMEKMYEDKCRQRAMLALRFGKNPDNKALEYFAEYPYRNYRSDIGNYGALKPADIERSGVDVEVRYKRLSPAEEAQQATMLVQLVNARLMSYDEALKRRGAREPEREWLKILKDGALMTPRVLMGLVGKAIMESGDEALIGAWQEAGMLEALKGGGGSPPAQPGVPSAAGAPGAGAPADMAQPGISANVAA